MATFVLVHGGWQGGWSWRLLAPLLRAAGHEVFVPTLTGLGERSHLAGMAINLDTHIADVANTILWEDLQDVILVGHSYGGMVVTGVADRLAERIGRLVYLDAVVPQDGSTLFTLRPEYLEAFMDAAGTGAGLMVMPRAASAFDTRPEFWDWLNARRTPHPLACFAQKIALTGAHRNVASRLYIYAQGGICDGMYDAYRGDPAARVVMVADTGHGVMIDQPEEVARILLEGLGQKAP